MVPVREVQAGCDVLVIDARGADLQVPASAACSHARPQVADVAWPAPPRSAAVSA